MARLADAHLTERVRELLGERSFHVLRQLGNRAVEGETGLDGDRQQVERIRQLGPHLIPARASLARDDEARNDETDCGQADAPS